MNAIITNQEAANDGYYLTPGKARDKRRLASVKARNESNARVFPVDGDYVTVKQIAKRANSTTEKVSKTLKLLRGQGLRKFTIDQFDGPLRSTG